MALDMSQFYQVFFEETEEHLGTMESLLLGVDPGNPDSEELNAIFRAAHSIKGSSATFGFADMAEVTHVLESLLDGVRKGERALSEDMVDGFLKAGDVLKAMLGAHRGEGKADPIAVECVCAQLHKLSSQAEVAPATAEPRDSVKVVPGDGEAAGPADADDGSYGFFAAEPTATPQPAFSAEAVGFFDENFAKGEETSATPAADASRGQSVADAGYGIFCELPPPSSESAKPVVPDMPQTATAERGPAVMDSRRTRDKAAPARASADAGSIRVSVEKVDQMINLVGELVITQAMLPQAASAVDPVTFERLISGLAQLERNTRDLQESVMSIRMLPISMIFSRFPRVVRDLSQKLGKQVELKVSGESTELDKGLIERISDPLTHLVRNSLDHGIEGPEERAAAGKPPIGTITLKAYHQSGNIVIEVGDDGAGLNRSRILATARERGLGVSDSMSDQEVWQLIFEASFSTADKVTEVSGRGVGMDVVKKNITAWAGASISNRCPAWAHA